MTLRIAVLVGSARPGCRSRTVVDWLVSTASRDDLELDVLDLADFDLPLAGPVWDPPEAVTAVLARTHPRLTAADGFVVITPEYNHSFPAVLKNFIDWHCHEWRAKPVAFVCHGGGLGGGLRAVEQLRLVFAELRAVTVRDTVSFQGGAVAFDESGRPREPDGCGMALKALLDDLTWWALALRDARAVRPYAV
ncbi:NAD(P)H-dependent FMN reductase [Crossiella equi]|uniref:NAD(P)H-dependent FMN reductase n=1 Tax=Crossiella equi TaxID=130796 RepID=A0ABS5A818_9PSEU|nr:NAD(P)H-dependent oxidoreductase [Crossiella equi]MBP2472397.1 NAD(P)H-dependent FMN reductase [Crossiella equi]